jgi:hypothetical protein
MLCTVWKRNIHFSTSGVVSVGSSISRWAVLPRVEVCCPAQRRAAACCHSVSGAAEWSTREDIIVCVLGGG